MRAAGLRLAQLVPTLLVVSALAFAMSAALGDPVGALLGPDASAALHAATAHALGLDRPLPERYAAFVWHALHGDFGISWREGRPVGAMLREKLPASVELAGAASAVALAVGLPTGLWRAVAPRAWPLRVAGLLATTVAAIPPFLIGLLLIQVFSVQAGWLPSFGRGDVVNAAGGWTTGLLTSSGRQALILPALTLGLFEAAVVMRLAQAEMSRALADRPIWFARARGLPRRAIRSQAWRLVRSPLASALVPQLGALIVFAVVTETVFRWPGIGALLIASIGSADVPVVAACLLLSGVLFGVLGIVADGLAALFDPRVRGLSALQ